MALTEKCSVYASVNEEALNRIVAHLMRQRPSLFNYGTQFFENNPGLLCKPPVVHPEILRRHNPIITIEDPLPILGTDGALGIDFCFQLVQLKIDIHPGRTVPLPPELNPPLAEQRFAIMVEVCGGISCPSPETAERDGEVVAIQVPSADGKRGAETDKAKPPVRPIQGKNVLCFCILLFATAGFEIKNTTGGPKLAIKLFGLEIRDITPEGLENNLECYLATTLRAGILPKIRIALDTIIFNLGDFATLSISPTPAPSVVAHNPALEQDEIRVFVDVGV